ncbi:MMPL family transporter [Actinomadura flavalba]|uniref:MMPL family transporter n=1 Tax=Actinomadura flavalba TaxID=1120938 RepID=UPI00037C3DDF|nr:MMPL family transporter [Actinomadura flavalba]
MLAGLGRLIHRRRWWSLLLILLLTAGAGAWGVGVLAKFKNGGFEDPKASSTLVAKLGNEYFGSTNPDLLVLYRSDTRTVDDPTYMRDVVTTVARLPKDRVAEVASYWSFDAKTAPKFASKDQHATIVSIKVAGDDDKAKGENYLWIKERLAAPDLTTQLGGAFPLGTEFGERVVTDIVRAELITALPLLILLLLLFGALGASLLPPFIAIFAIVGGFALLHAITYVADVNSMALEVVTMMGVGLTIDYSLFIISRFREELKRGLDERGLPPGKPWKIDPTRKGRREKRKAYRRMADPVRQAALARTMVTAGRTIIVSGITVSAALAGLLVFPQMFLRTIGLAGIATVLVAVFGAVVLLPTLIACLGRGIEFGQMPWRRRAREKDDDRRFWYRLGLNVMRFPLPYFALVLAVLAVLSGPFLNVQFGQVDVRILPKDSPTRQVVETIEREFPSRSTEPIDVVISGDLFPRDFRPVREDEVVPKYIEDFRARLAGLPGVTEAALSGWNGDYGGVRISVFHEHKPMEPEAVTLVREIKKMELTKDGFPMHLDVGGSTAAQLDQNDSLVKALPKMAILVCVSTFLLLFMAFGSILLPIKAILMNVLSIGASFGVIVWGFQYGHLAGVLGFTPTGAVEATSMILILAVVFGLSMDYEVFLLSRIREEWDRTHDNREAVARGMQYTGGIITSAALLFLIVIAAFAGASLTVVKLIGVGMFVAIVIDAALVRSLLVPATMRFLGAANWWLPKPLAGLHKVLDLGEVSDASGPAVKPPPLPEEQPYSIAVRWTDESGRPVRPDPAPDPRPAYASSVPPEAPHIPITFSPGTSTTVTPAPVPLPAPPSPPPSPDDGRWEPWAEGEPQRPAPRKVTRTRREIHPNPDGAGWSWREVEETVDED